MACSAGSLLQAAGTGLHTGIFLQAAGTGLYTADMPWKGLINKYGICIKQKL